MTKSSNYQTDSPNINLTYSYTTSSPIVPNVTNGSKHDRWKMQLEQIKHSAAFPQQLSKRQLSRRRISGRLPSTTTPDSIDDGLRIRKFLSNIYRHLSFKNHSNGDDDDDDEDGDLELSIFDRRKRHEIPSNTQYRRNNYEEKERSNWRKRLLLQQNVNDTRSKSLKEATINYPVSLHEALFHPEFSIKGPITEGDFTVLDIIANGAFGNVLKVSFNETDIVYAMKIMSKQQIMSDLAVQQVKDEALIQNEIGQSLPTLVVPVHSFWQSKRFLYIVSEYVPNGELLALWSKMRGQIPLEIIKIYLVEVSLVLEFLHRRGILYRDVKMENILLSKRGHLKIVDFGLSKYLPIGNYTTTVCGTLQYMAPEILQVQPYDHCVDWWSLGILMYALVVGKYPINGCTNRMTMAEKLIKNRIELPLKYGVEANSCITRLLSRNPTRRIKNLSQLRYTSFMKTASFDLERIQQINIFQYLSKYNSVVSKSYDCSNSTTHLHRSSNHLFHQDYSNPHSQHQTHHGHHLKNSNQQNHPNHHHSHHYEEYEDNMRLNQSGHYPHLSESSGACTTSLFESSDILSSNEDITTNHSSSILLETVI
ncbi:hypothetical protein SNEBB_004406 [Seison nebaliae]|nr:hypothetical protein SNEBB_004406 [Seison nebaliae]